MNDFQEIIDAWLDGTITDEQVRRLNRSLLESEECAGQFASQVQLQYLIRECYANDANPVAALLSSAQAENAPAPRCEPLPAARWKSRRLLLAIGAAPLLFLLWMAFGVIDQGALRREEIANRNPSHAQPIAVIQSLDVPGDNVLKLGQTFYANDRIQLAAGTLSLRFLLGVTVDLVAPVDLELVSENLTILHRGHLTADVELAAVGFTVETPHADIIDQGTKFGVNVQESGQADVVVFEGRVDIDSRRRDLDESKTQSERLTTGEAMRIEGLGEYYRIPVVRSSADSIAWSTKIGETESEFVSSVSDNLPTSSRPIYYGLVPGGFDEDALCYVDRAHQWNSLPGIPFPEPLRGGDYLRLMNDLKFIINLDVKISLRRAADVYVLMDQRVPPPIWLARDFTKTPMTIGGDEAKEGDSRSILRTFPLPSSQERGVGPGESVDQTYNIWMRRCAAGDVILGSLVEDLAATDPDSPKVPIENFDIPFSGSFYGVVVTAPSSLAEIPAVPSEVNSP